MEDARAAQERHEEQRDQQHSPCQKEHRQEEGALPPIGHYRTVLLEITTMPLSVTVKRFLSSSGKYPICMPSGITTSLSTIVRWSFEWRPTLTFSNRIESVTSE